MCMYAWYVCVYMPMFVHMCMQMNVHVCACTCGGQKLTSDVFINHFPLPCYFWFRISHGAWSSQIQSDQLSTKLLGSSYLCPWNAEVTDKIPYLHGWQGSELRSSFLNGKSFSDWDIAWVPVDIMELQQTECNPLPQEVVLRVVLWYW